MPQRDPEAECEGQEHCEIALVGELGDNQADLHEKLLAVPAEGECTIYFNSPGGDPYCALSLMTLILVRRLECTALVTGECSSAALWPFAACRRRLVTPYSVFLFHSLRWESGENIQPLEASEWARHFQSFAGQTDQLLADHLGLPLAQVTEWNSASSYVSGGELVRAGCAEMVDVGPRQ